MFVAALHPCPNPFSRDAVLLSSQTDEVINVDVLHPERNGRVQVFQIANVQKDGILHNGYKIAIDGDMRYVYQEQYKATLVSDNEVMLEIPSIGFSFLHEGDSLNKRINTGPGGYGCARTQESHDVARNKIRNDKARMIKRVLLRFPEEEKLSNAIYSPSLSDDEITIQVVSLTSKVDLAGTKISIMEARVAWKVSIFEEEKRVVKQAAPTTNSSAAMLSAQLSSMVI